MFESTSRPNALTGTGLRAPLRWPGTAALEEDLVVDEAQSYPPRMPKVRAAEAERAEALVTATKELSRAGQQDGRRRRNARSRPAELSNVEGGKISNRKRSSDVSRRQTVIAKSNACAQMRRA